MPSDRDKPRFILGPSQLLGDLATAPPATLLLYDEALNGIKMVPRWGSGRLFRLWPLAKFPPSPTKEGGARRNYSDSSRRTTDISSILSKPSWSVQSLLPSRTPASTRVTSEQLRHLLRLSALPPPRSLREETQMLETLDSQLHFVRQIQSLKADLVAPLKSIRDESAAADSECGIGYEELKGALGTEDIKRANSPARQRSAVLDPSDESKEAEDWDVLGQAKLRVGRYFVVETVKE
ncbi:hypothetical protein GP486_004906 [Trichoglossum hirsutum]|uniref:Glutamyl-tRNA amidotransferase complex subunit Gta3 domain-containing protein n=1 Tax=Trichoglossum hirsutum TaxID=265104 RepID=A0A9P8RN84_9PEZI|nr:hypothetical protein GP486_004906 [Trichoglossum hirsutum]